MDFGNQPINEWVGRKKREWNEHVTRMDAERLVKISKERTPPEEDLQDLLSCCSWSHVLQPKKLSVSVAVPPAPVRIPSQSPLAPSVASVISVANDKGNNEMKLSWGCEQISWHLPYSRGKPQKSSARRPSPRHPKRRWLKQAEPPITSRRRRGIFNLKYFI